MKNKNKIKISHGPSWALFHWPVHECWGGERGLRCPSLTVGTWERVRVPNSQVHPLCSNVRIQSTEPWALLDWSPCLVGFSETKILSVGIKVNCLVNCSSIYSVPPHRLLSRDPEKVFWRRSPRDTVGPPTHDWQMALWRFSKAFDGPSRFPAKQRSDISKMTIGGERWNVFTHNKLLET